MGTSLTTTHKLIKPDDNEAVNIDQLNQNFDTIDAAIPVVLVNKLPEGKTPKIWAGMVATETGAGGSNRTASGATNAAGAGGFWPGYQGIPKFEGISSVVMTQNNGGADQFDVHATIVFFDATRIQFRAKRGDNSLATNYGSIGFHMIIAGW